MEQGAGGWKKKQRTEESTERRRDRHQRAAFEPIAKEIIECNGIWVTGSDYSEFKFEKIRRPIFPLDEI